MLEILLSCMIAVVDIASFFVPPYYCYHTRFGEKLTILDYFSPKRWITTYIASYIDTKSILQSLSVRDTDIIEIDGPRSAIIEHEPAKGSSGRKISINRAERGSIEPSLCMASTGLIVLYLHTVPGIGAQSIVGAEDGVDSSIGSPEVDIQPMPIGVVIDLPSVAAIVVVRKRQLSATSHATVDAEGEAGESVVLGTRRQCCVDIGILPTGVGESQGIRPTVDHRPLHTGSAGTIAVGQGPGIEIATLKAIAEVHGRDDPGSAECHRLGTVGGTVGER